MNQAGFGRYLQPFVKARWDKSGKFNRPITTEITAATKFYSAAEYHQKYLVKNPGGYSCHVWAGGVIHEQLFNLLPPALHPVGHLPAPLAATQSTPNGYRWPDADVSQARCSADSLVYQYL